MTLKLSIVAAALVLAGCAQLPSVKSLSDSERDEQMRYALCETALKSVGRDLQNTYSFNQTSLAPYDAIAHAAYVTGLQHGVLSQDLAKEDRGEVAERFTSLGSSPHDGLLRGCAKKVEELQASKVFSSVDLATLSLIGEFDLEYLLGEKARYLPKPVKAFSELPEPIRHKTCVGSLGSLAGQTQALYANHQVLPKTSLPAKELAREAAVHARKAASEMEFSSKAVAYLAALEESPRQVGLSTLWACHKEAQQLLNLVKTSDSDLAALDQEAGLLLKNFLKAEESFAANEKLNPTPRISEEEAQAQALP